MLKVKRKLASFVLAGIMALSVSLSAVAEEVPEGVEDSNVCTEEHEHEHENSVIERSLAKYATWTNTDPGNCQHNFQGALITEYVDTYTNKSCTEKMYKEYSITICMMCRYGYGKSATTTFRTHSFVRCPDK